MDRFEQQFESLDVQTNVMGDAMQSTTTMTTPQNEVDSLMQQVADEAGIELNSNLPQAQTSTIGVATASQDQDELSQRLAKLRQTWEKIEIPSLKLFIFFNFFFLKNINLNEWIKLIIIITINIAFLN